MFKDKYDMVKDESTGEMIMVEKGAKQYKLDAQGNIINPPPSSAPEPASTGPSPFNAVFGGGVAAPAPAGSGFAFGGSAGGSGGGGFVFGGSSGGGGGGGFVFGGMNGEGSGGAAAAAGGFVFGGAPPTPNQPEKRGGELISRTAVKRRRTRDLRLSGSESGFVYVVGNGDCGQLGLGAGDDDVRDSLKPIRLATLDAVRVCQLACGGLHTAALTVDGQVWTWGCNDDEVLGRQEEESEPHRVCGALDGATVVFISAGDCHMGALVSTGQVYTWGTYKDSNGYIGYSPAQQKAKEPTLVPKLPEIGLLACGADHTLAVARDGYNVYAWGCGEKGQLGRDILWDATVEKETKKQHLLPAAPFDIRVHDRTALVPRDRLKLALNDNFVTVVRAKLAADEGFDCTEACEHYLEHRAQLDKADADVEEHSKLQVRGVYGGAYHSFVLTQRGNVYAFGLNNMGQLGLGSLEPVHTAVPTLVTALENKGVCQLVGGEHHSVALTEDGDVYGFGRGDSHQLGFGDGTDQETTPRRVMALEGVAVRKLASGSNQNVAVTRTGDMYSWGFGEMGQLGNCKSCDEPTPCLVEASSLASMAVIGAASGAQHSVLLAVERED